MPLPVNLQAVVDELQVGVDDWRSYVNRKTGELASFDGEVRRRVEDEDPPDDGWQLEQWQDCKRVLEDDDFIALPSKFDIHKYSIMERFCLSRNDEALRDRLLDAIAGRGAFRRFRDLVHGKGITDDWYRYRDGALKRIAADVLEDHRIPYVDQSTEPTAR